MDITVIKRNKNCPVGDYWDNGQLDNPVLNETLGLTGHSIDTKLIKFYIHVHDMMYKP